MAVKNVIVLFEDETSREFGRCAWNWQDGVLTILKFIQDPHHGRRSVPLFQAPFDAVKCIDVEYDEEEVQGNA